MSILVMCPDCIEGQVEKQAFCTKPVSDCCGGCVEYEICERCNGSAKVSTLDLDEDELREELEAQLKTKQKILPFANAAIMLLQIIDKEANDYRLGANIRRWRSEHKVG